MRCAIINDYQVVSVGDFSEEEIQSLQTSNQAVVSIDGMIPEPGPGWVLNGSKLIPPASADMAELICIQVYDPLVEKLAKIRRRFIGENILWGITELGKTAAVGDFMETVEKWFNRSAPMEVIKQLEIKKAQLAADPALAASLAPFVTMGRLDWYKSEVLKALGVG